MLRSLAALTAALWLMPGSSSALVNPVTLIERQVIKPNMLIVLDTSTSMMNSPGDKDLDANEVGEDCDDGDDQCRLTGTPGRCFWAGTGAMGAGVRSDHTSCHNNAECRVGYCKSNAPKSCDEDADCDGTCKGFCSNNNNTACTSNANCGTGKCRGVCSESVKPTCTTDADCTGVGNYCTVYANDVCITSGSAAKAKICVQGQNRCRTDADCTAYAGDTCGPGTSRLVVAKRVLSSIVSSYYNTVNFGLMTFYQSNYYPYYPTTGSITNHDITRFLDRDQLKAFGCWTKSGGPAGACTMDGQPYNRRANPDSKYRIKTGANTFTLVDSNWCGVWCPLAASGGTGHYVGSYYTYTDPQATLSSTTPIIETTYQGKTITKSGTKYIYWNPPTELRNQNNIYGVNAPNDEQPIDAGDSGGSCTATSGGRGDTTVAPFMDTTNDATKAQQMAWAVLGKMDKAGLGGVAAEGFTPTGCTLGMKGIAAATDTNNAYSYMAKVKSTDSLASCRNNYVLLVTDGAPNRAYDAACNSAACASADPRGAGCTCQAVNSAQDLKSIGVQTFVVGFSGATTGAYEAATLNNIAKAGGTSQAFFAVREAELRTAIVNAIYAAAVGSYSTSPASSSSGVQTGDTISLGSIVLDTRVDFPGWKGQLIAYETSSGTPAVAWSANTVAFNATADPNFWKKRRVWTSEGTTMIPIQVDQATGAITNKAKLKSLGLGATDDEAERAAKWLLGDPAMGNPAVLGAIINSTPIDVGPPGQSPLPGGVAFHQAHSGRPALTYVGSSDGMLHAFFTKNATVGGTSYLAGQEAFAYIPQTMLAVANKLFAQGGQLPDPKDHIYGLANSPKVKSLCTANCDGLSGTPQWRTVLAMAYGFGGTEAFSLDITNPFDGAGVKTASAPAPLLWSTQYMNPSSTSAYDNELGLTTSVPAFYYAKGASKADFRLIFGSYYTDGATGSMGKVVINASASTGSIVQDIKINPGNSCSQAFGLLSDVATARNYSATEEVQIHAAYFGDTWGNLYRYVPAVSGASNYTSTTGSYSTVEAFTCNQPVHYAPAIVQMDRDNATNRPGEIYIVQVTNSALDEETKNFPASKLIIRRDLASAPGVVGNDATFAKIELNAGVAAQICGVTNAAGTSCVEALPATARPNATPMAVLKADGTGFQIISTWYNPAVNACADGVTYLTIHEVTPGTGVKTKFGMKLASEPVTSAVFANGRLMFVKQSGVTDLTSMLPPTLTWAKGGSGTNNASAERVRRLAWNEIP